MLFSKNGGLVMMTQLILKNIWFGVFVLMVLSSEPDQSRHIHVNSTVKIYFEKWQISRDDSANFKNIWFGVKDLMVEILLSESGQSGLIHKKWRKNSILKNGR
jgi:hypothetical protein